MHSVTRAVRRVVLLSLLTTAFTSAAHADVAIWKGGGNNLWSDPTDWSTFTYSPAVGDPVHFAAPVTAPIYPGLTNDSSNILGAWATVGANWAVANFDGSISAYTNYTTISNSTLTTAPNANIRLDTSAAKTYTANKIASSSTTLTLSSANFSSVSVGETVTGTGIAEGTFITKILSTPANSVTLSNPATSTNGSVSLIFLPAITLATAGTTDVHTLLDSSTDNRMISIGTGNTLRLGADGGIFRSDNTTSTNLTIGTAPNVGTLTAGGADNLPGTLILNANNPSQITSGIVVNATIADNGTGAVSLVTTGVGNISQAVNAGGSVTLNGNNTYTGGTLITLGRILATNTSALSTGTVTVEGSGQVELAATGTYTNNFNIAGAGTYSDSSGALRIDTDVTLSGSLTSNTGSSLGNFGHTATLSGNLQGTGALSFFGVGTASSTYILTGSSSTFSGPLIVSTNTITNGISTTLQIGRSQTLPATVTIALNASNDSVILDLAGHTQTLAAVTSGGTTLTNALITNFSATPATLTLASTTDSRFDGKISDGLGTLALIKSGLNTLTLTNALYTGTTTVSAGTLALPNGAFSSLITVQTGATLQAGGSLAGSVVVNGSLVTTAPLTILGTLTLGWDPTSNTLATITTTNGSLLGSGSITLAITTHIDYSQAYTFPTAILPAGWTLSNVTGFDGSNYADTLTHSANGYSLSFLPLAGAPVPEPTSLAAAATYGILGLLSRRRRA